MAYAVQITKSANTPAIVTSAGLAVAENINRQGWSITNTGTNPLFVRLGGTASATEFHFILKGGSVAEDGLGGSISQTDGAVFYGDIYVAGTSPRFVVLEM